VASFFFATIYSPTIITPYYIKGKLRTLLLHVLQDDLVNSKLVIDAQTERTVGGVKEKKGDVVMMM